MNFDPMTVTAGVVGLGSGIAVALWRPMKALEERCEFMADVGRDLREAFDNVGDVLDDKHTPKPIRDAIIVLLAAHADKAKGEMFADAFMRAWQAGHTPSEGKDPISQSMSVLGRVNPALARRAHHVMASLTFGLVFLNLADDIKVERIKDQAAKDPVSLWARIARIFGSASDDQGHDAGGRLLHA